MKSWTLSLFRQTRPYLTLGSFWQYRNFLCNPDQDSNQFLELQLKAPFGHPVYLRKGSSDIATFKEIFIDQVYHSVIENVKDCRTLIDVGANIGLASVYMSQHYGRELKCMAVEANPDTFRILKRNFDGKSAQLLHAAAWDCETTLTSSCRDERYSMSTVSQATDGDTIGLPLAEIIRRSGFQQVDLLKIDIEGAEVKLFTGDLDWLKSVRTIAIEFHADSREQMGFDRVMRQYGFRVIDGDHTSIAIRG